MIKKKFGNPQATFSDRVIKIALSIPRGKVMTYGQIAQKAGGGPMASRSVTGILGKASSMLVVGTDKSDLSYPDGHPRDKLCEF